MRSFVAMYLSYMLSTLHSTPERKNTLRFLGYCPYGVILSCMNETIWKTFMTFVGLGIGISLGHMWVYLVFGEHIPPLAQVVPIFALNGKVQSVDVTTHTITIVAVNPYAPIAAAPFVVHFDDMTNIKYLTQGDDVSHTILPSSPELLAMQPGTRIKAFISRANGPLHAKRLLINAKNLI